MEDINVILNNKIDKYGYRVEDNLLAPSELTVTITLNEYRNLVSRCATREEAIEKANNERYKATSEVEELKKELTKLKTELYDLTKDNRDIEEGVK